jgi:hypothetical protein
MDAVRAHHRQVDDALGAARRGAGPRTVILVVGDPGRLARRAEGAEGLFVLAGTPAKPGAAPAGGERDVAPTVLHLLGLPVSDELEGAVLTSALSPDFLAANPVRRVATYGRPATRPARDSAFDREMLEELRSLGYIH